MLRQRKGTIHHRDTEKSIAEVRGQIAEVKSLTTEAHEGVAAVFSSNCCIEKAEVWVLHRNAGLGDTDSREAPAPTSRGETWGGQQTGTLLLLRQRHDWLGRVAARFARSFPATGADETDRTVR